MYPFDATNPHELSIRSGQTVWIAPREVQNTHKLLNTGWLLATVDQQVAGIIPVNYIEHAAPQRPDTFAGLNTQTKVEAEQPAPTVFANSSMPTMPEEMKRSDDPEYEDDRHTVSA